MPNLVTEANAFLADFERREQEEAGRTPGWLLEVRREAMRAFLDQGFPTRRDEEWIYTDVTPLRRHRFPLAPRTSTRPATLAPQRFALGLDRGPRLVFLNGRFEPTLSRTGTLPEGTELGPLAEALTRTGAADGPGAVLGTLAAAARHPFVALNTAFLADGLWLRLPPGACVDDPIQAIFLAEPRGEPSAAHPRLLLDLGAGARAVVVERYGLECVGALGEVGGLTNTVLEARLGAGAALEVVRVQREGGAEHHLGFTAARLARDARFTQVAVTLGGALCRHETHVELAEPGAACDLSGLYALAGREHADHHTVVRHAAPRCTSRQLYKGVLAGRSIGAFTGRVIVEADAQQTAAEQANHNLLLSPEALAETRPQLEIHADDVKCSHGATIGQLDDEALFYLRTRGLDAAAAGHLLVHAFADEVIERASEERVRAGLAALLAARLDLAPGAGGRR